MRALRFLAAIVATIGVAFAGAAAIGPASAVAPVSITSKAGLPAATYAYHVPPITCETVDTCQWSYNGTGYWMARRFDHPGLWVRLTIVAGWDNTQAAPITCATEDQCVIDYYTPGRYIMGRQWNGTTWVRMSLLP